MLWKRSLCFCLAIVAAICVSAPARAEAEDVRVTEVRTEIGENHVSYPQLQGMRDEAIQKAINDDIVMSSEVTRHMITLSTLGGSAWGLKVDYRDFMMGDVYSVVIEAKGKMPTGREGQSYAALSYDMRTGARLTLDDVFADPEAAVAHMEALAWDSLADELSGYMAHGDISPLPAANFALDADGITFYYPADQFLLLSGYCGACQFYYGEVEAFLKAEPDGIPARVGALSAQYSADEARALIRQSMEDGVWPRVPVKLGDSMSDVAQRCRLLREPDEFPGGRYFVLEAPAFRQVLVISDAMQSGYERSVVEGLQIKRGDLYGLRIGETSREKWRALLGEPDQTITFTQNMAFDYNLPAVLCDCYIFGANELRLYANENDVLTAAQLGR